MSKYPNCLKLAETDLKWLTAAFSLQLPIIQALLVHPPMMLVPIFVGGGERLGHFGRPERAKLPQVDGDENVAALGKVDRVLPAVSS